MFVTRRAPVSIASRHLLASGDAAADRGLTRRAQVCSPASILVIQALVFPNIGPYSSNIGNYTIILVSNSGGLFIYLFFKQGASARAGAAILGDH